MKPDLKLQLLDWQNIETTSCRYGTMSYLKSDLIIGQALREYGEWAQGELDFLLDIIDAGNTVIDAGAFIGTHTLAFARHVGPEGQIYAFEPHPIAFELLKLNIEQNELPNIKPFDVALSDTKGTLHVPKAVLNDVENPEQLSLSIGSEVASKDADSVDIKLVPLDQCKMDRCDLIKIDVEGMELNVLKGSAKTLRRFRPLVFAECLSLHNGWQIVLFMRDNGFEAFLHNELSYNPDNFRKNTNNFPGAARETNIVFVPANRISAFQKRCKHFGSLIPLRTLDDLALGMLKKPQYKYEVLAPTTAAKILGIDFLVNEPELRQLADTASRVPLLEASLREKVIQIQSLESQVQQFQQSITMQLVNRYGRIVEKLLRSGTRRRHYYERMLNRIRIFLNKG